MSANLGVNTHDMLQAMSGDMLHISKSRSSHALCGESQVYSNGLRVPLTKALSLAGCEACKSELSLPNREESLESDRAFRIRHRQTNAIIPIDNLTSWASENTAWNKLSAATTSSKSHLRKFYKVEELES